MASIKAAEIGIGEARWLDKAQAMAWVGVKTEETFNAEWGLYLNLYDNGGKGGRYDKRQIDSVMEKRLVKKAMPYGQDNR